MMRMQSILSSSARGKKPIPCSTPTWASRRYQLLYYQVLLDHVAVSREKSYRESLKFGLQEWNRTQHGHPGYGRGRQGYDNLIAALGRDDLNLFGLSYILACIRGRQGGCGALPRVPQGRVECLRRT